MKPFVTVVNFSKMTILSFLMTINRNKLNGRETNPACKGELEFSEQET